MSKEYLSNPEPKKNPDQQPPKRDNRVVILLSVILVVLLAIVTFIIVVSLKSKNGNENNPSGTPTVAESEREFSHGTKEFPQAGGEFPSGGNTSASSDAQSSATAAPNAQQSQIDSQGSSQPQAGQNTPQPTPAPNTNPGGTVTPDNGSQKPADGIETLNYYNRAINKAVSGKVGYQKTRVTDNEKMDGSAALQAMKSLVYKFMGIGAENAYNETVEKGKWGDVAFLTNSKLTVGDVTSATCVEKGSHYIITLTLKSGSSVATQSSHSTPANQSLDKCGICVGSEDKAYFDHKTGSVIYDALDDVYPTAEIKETYTNAKVVATVDSSTGNLVSLVVEWNESVTLSKLLGMSATASGVCHVTYNNFKW